MRQRGSDTLSSPLTPKHTSFTKGGRKERRVYGLRDFVVESDPGHLDSPESLGEGSLSTSVRFLVDSYSLRPLEIPDTLGNPVYKRSACREPSTCGKGMGGAGQPRTPQFCLLVQRLMNLMPYSELKFYMCMR